VRERAAGNHESWFARGRETVALDGTNVYVGAGDAVIAFPDSDADLASAVGLARAAGVGEVSCWALAPDARLGDRLRRLGFQDGWQPHWMGLDPRETAGRSDTTERTTACDPALPYASQHHTGVLGGDVHHLVVRDGAQVVGHTVLNVVGDSGGVYDMGVAEQHRRRGHGGALVSGLIVLAHELGCTSVTLNATHEGALLYRTVGFESLGHGMTWWLFPRRDAA
jgi:ribosomal protein S18 acetylase RimI-like enzyme